MKPISNYENVQASTGDFAKPKAGGYICRIVDVEDVPYDAVKQSGDYLKIYYDIADGEFENYYSEANVKFGGEWWAKFIRSYKEKALGMFKHFTNCIEASNIGYTWDWNEKALKGKIIGLVIGEEEYEKKDGGIGVKTYVKDVKTVDDIKQGNYKTPDLKTIPRATATPNFEVLEDDEQLPF